MKKLICIRNGPWVRYTEYGWHLIQNAPIFGEIVEPMKDYKQMPPPPGRSSDQYIGIDKYKGAFAKEHFTTYSLPKYLLIKLLIKLL